MTAQPCVSRLAAICSQSSAASRVVIEAMVVRRFGIDDRRVIGELRFAAGRIMKVVPIRHRSNSLDSTPLIALKPGCS
jgi:hypothetical protein